MNLAALRHSLSVRVLSLTLGVMLLTELAIFLPGLARARHTFLIQHIRRAEIAAQAASSAADIAVARPLRNNLLRLAYAQLVRVRTASGTVIELVGDHLPVPADEVDMRTESYLSGMRRAIAALLSTSNGALRIIAPAPMQPGATIEEIVQEHSLSTQLQQYTLRIAELWLPVMLVTGTLLYLALLVFLIRPMRRLTHSIALFRADPDHVVAPDEIGGRAPDGDEIAAAWHELAHMQTELRNALWRNARLAALGTTLAKVSHDIRGILSAALLTADRLTTHADPKVAHAGEVMVTAVERATLLMRQTLDFARDAPPPPARTSFPLRALISEASPAPGGASAPRLDIDVDPALTVEADRDQLLRVFANLIRNAAEAGATSIQITATQCPPVLEIVVRDDGPGLPEMVQANLFRPFVSSGRPGGTGLGLAIVRDLMRAQGGDATLVATGPEGTSFRLSLPL
jgi:signal transduction histidine kinase